MKRISNAPEGFRRNPKISVTTPAVKPTVGPNSIEIVESATNAKDMWSVSLVWTSKVSLMTMSSAISIAVATRQRMFFSSLAERVER